MSRSEWGAGDRFPADHTGSALLHSTLTEEMPTRLAVEALAVSGASSVQVYLWDQEVGFLYGAGAAGVDGAEPDSIGFPLGDGVGFIFFRGCSPTLRQEARLRPFVKKASRLLAHRQRMRHDPCNPAEEATIAFLNVLRAKSPDTGAHCARVARFAAATAVALGLSERQVCVVERCGLLHDIGKIGVAEQVLEKPASLTSEEWSLIKAHPEAGVAVLRPCRSLAAILPAIASHHERYDGQGYPRGLAGEAIPLEARIVNVCDAFDTMITGRPYRQPLGLAQAVQCLEEGAGSQFDPRIVAVFVERVVTEMVQ